MPPRRASRVVSCVLGLALGTGVAVLCSLLRTWFCAETPMTATGVLAHEQAAVRALPWHAGRVATRAYHWPCCRSMRRPAALAMSASRCPGRAWLRSHLAHQPRAGVRRQLAGAVEHEEVSSWQRENVDASKCPVDSVFAHVVCGHHGDVLA